MNNVVNASATAGFNAGTGEQGITITGHAGVVDPVQGIPLRVYPPECNLYVTDGTIQRGTTRMVEIPGDVIQFVKSNDAALRWPPAYGVAPSIEVIWAIDTEGLPINIAEIDFTVDAVGKVRASRVFTGLARIGTYNALYELVYYRPSPARGAIRGSDYHTLHYTYGTLVAYKDDAIAVFDIPLPEFPAGMDRVELWRVVSDTIIDPEGEWELPPNWDSGYNGTFNGQQGPDKDASVRKQRVHEIGYISPTGMHSWYETFTTFLQKPFPQNRAIRNSATPGFQPVITLSTASIPSVSEDASVRAAAAQYIAERRAIRLIR